MNPTPRPVRLFRTLRPLRPVRPLRPFGMRLAPLIAALSLGLTTASHAAPTPLPPIADGLPKASHFALPNGLEVLLVPNVNNPILELHLGFRTGSGADALSKEGTASLLGRMTTAGLEDLPEQALAKELARLGAWISADVALESFSIGGQVPTFDNAEVLRFLDLFFRVALDNPLPADLLEREKTLRLGALSRALDNADALADVAAAMVAQPGAHGRPGFGTFTSIPTLTRDDLVTFRDRVFAPKNAVLVIGGAFDEAGLTAWLTERLATWNPPVTIEKGLLPGRPARLCRDNRCLDNLVATPSTATVSADTLLITIDDPNLSQIPFRLVGKNPIAMLDPRWSAFRLGTFILGGDFTSRLMQTLRVREGLTYGAYFSPDFGAYESGAMMVSTDATPDALSKAITLAKAELTTFIETPIPSDELERSRLMLIEAFAFKFETISKTLEQYTSHALASIPLTWLADWKRHLAAPTADDISLTLGPIAPDKLALIVAGPASLEAQLKALGHGKLRVISARDLLTSPSVSAPQRAETRGDRSDRADGPSRPLRGSGAAARADVSPHPRARHPGPLR